MAKVFELKNELIGNGTDNYVDTGIKLISNEYWNSGFTIIIDFTTSDSTNNESLLFCMYEESPYNGFVFESVTEIFATTLPNQSSFSFTKENNTRYLYAFCLDPNNKSYHYYNERLEFQNFSIANPLNTVNETLHLGCKVNTAGTRHSFTTATIHRCVIYNELLPLQDIHDYMHGTSSDDNDQGNTFDDPADSGEEYQDSNLPPMSTGTGGNNIEGLSEDTWGSENYGLPSALYFYYMGDDINGGNEYENWNTEYTNAVLGNCSAIQSVQYVPFIRKDDMDLKAVPYDVARFGQLQASHPKLDYAPYVYRVKSLTNHVKTLGTFIPYAPTKSIGGKRNWRNESRLYNYPYQFAMITDHLNQPMEVKYHLIGGNKATVKVLNTISDRCSYGLFIEGYKGDNGKLEALVSTEAHELPCSSSAYNQWYASNKNQVAQNVANMSQNAFLNNQNISQNQNYNILNSTVGAIGNAISMNWGGVASNIIGGFQNNMNMNFQKQMNNVGVQQQIAMNMAMGQDLRNTPNTMISMGSDVYYGLSKGNYQLDLYRFGLTEEYNKKLGDYFALYGYKQNRVMSININNRYYYNYIKTVGANIHGEKIPRNHLEQIKQIFDNGVTIWHTYRSGLEVGDYSMDNKEV